MSNDIELVHYFRVPLTMFRFLGIDIAKSQTTHQRCQLLYTLCKVVYVKVLVSALIFMSLYLLYGQPESELDIMANMCYWGFFICSFVVVAIIFYMADKLNYVFMGLLQYYPRKSLERSDFQLARHLKLNNKLKICIIAYDFATVSMFSFAPLLQSVYEYNSDSRPFVYRFPFMFWYPFDVRPWPMYTYAYTLQVLTGFFSSSLFMACDLLIICEVRTINMYFGYLKKRIIDFEPDGSDEDIERFTPFIKFHADMQKYTKIISGVFSGFNLLRYLMSGFLMCMLCIQIALGTDILYLFKFIAFLIATLIHMSFITYAADELIQISSEISLAYAHHKWYMGNMKFQKMMILTIAMGQQKCALSAYKFFDLSMVSFKKLLSISYQVFTLLRSTLDKS